MRKTTPSFITEFELNTLPADDHVLSVRLDCARQVYNACLGEGLKRVRLMAASDLYKQAKALPRTVNEVPNPQRKALFVAAREQFAFSEYDLHGYATQFSHSWLDEHLDSNTIQKLATRAYKAVNEYLLGKRGKPRFKGKNRPLKSVEGKSNAAGIRFKNRRIEWSGLKLDLLIDVNDPVQQYGLASRIKYVRIVRREIRSKIRWFAQLVCEGQPYRKAKNAVGSGTVGLDIGPSTVAIVAPEVEHVDLRQFCDELGDKAKEIAKLQRQIDRQRRAANPANYHPDRWVKNANGNWERKKGIIRKGRHEWAKSKRMVANQAQLRDMHRQLAAHRKSLQGKMVNDVLAMGDTIKTEKLSYKAFQRLFGKSVGKRAPGMFMEHLRRKAESAGGQVLEFPTKTTRLSQTCHGCGTIEKKPLKQRWHVCACGVVQQRDLYSAFLATCVEHDRLVGAVADVRYRELDCVLWATASRTESVIGQAMPARESASFFDTANLVEAPSQNGLPVISNRLGESHCVQLSLFLSDEPDFVLGTPAL